MSNIKVTVEWESPVIFAGEEVRCIITFKNSSPAVNRSRSLSPYVNGHLGSGRDRWKQDLPKKQPLPKRTQSLRKAEERATRSQVRAHRPVQSLGGPSLSRESSRGPPVAGPSGRVISNPRGHGRSLSIVSLGSNKSTTETKSSASNVVPTRRYHNRAASLQILPARSGGSPLNSPSAIPSPQRATAAPMRRTHSSNASISNVSQQSTGNTSIGPSNGRSRNNSRTSSNVPDSPPEPAHRLVPSRTSTSNTLKGSPTIPFSPPSQQENHNPSFVSKNKNPSPTSQAATPRSSLELYSQSNHSTETLASEYILPSKNNQPVKSTSRRGTYLSTVPDNSNKTETLMMGYVQLSGSFTLDGSLINMAPFESVKMKGVIGGQGGGGVVGVEKSKRENGLLGSFGWGGIGQSLGGLIGGQEMSSIKEMKGIASTKAIPIISTPHSILFVNLTLQPGESKSFSYTYPLPEDIPPTYKGRAIKIEYQLVIGTQRPQQSTQSQLIRHADFGFKVLSGVTLRGELPVYDLKMPHIILKDTATSQVVESEGSVQRRLEETISRRKTDSEAVFVSYVENLLSDVSGFKGSLISPTETRSNLGSDVTGRYSARDLIELAILRGNSSATSRGSANRFDIHRAGERVATIVLAKSAYRLGERIIAGIDFQDAILPCYAVHAFLETVEEVDESIALRSNASITRATRRIQASCFENAICARRLSLSFMIPTTAAPEFRTSNIQFKWSLRIEFTIGKTMIDLDDEEGLLEEVTEDERGRILAAAQELPCESFDVMVPIRVYGGIGEAKESLVMSSTV